MKIDELDAWIDSEISARGWNDEIAAEAQLVFEARRELEAL